jgi:PPOX class probable F420-dependent enzyme
MATGINFAVLSTLMPDGHPQTQVVWLDADRECLIVNSDVSRRKYLNLRLDPRATVTVWDISDPYRYIEARGRAVEFITGEAALRHIHQVSRRYTGADLKNPITADRVIIRIAIDRLHKNHIDDPF